jgi:hypothetical protein
MSYSELSGQEKKQIVRSQIKNIQYNKYNAELNIIQEQSLSEPSQATLAALNNELSKCNIKEQALLVKLQELELEYPEIEEGEEVV